MKFSKELAREYQARFGDALRLLGYAPDSDWVEECSPRG